MDQALFRQLRTPEGQRLLDQASQAYADPAADPVGISARLRREHAPELVAAALTQARLRRAAVVKFGSDAELMYFTAEGLEQATTRQVAEHRASRLAASLGPTALSAAAGASTAAGADPAAGASAAAGAGAAGGADPAAGAGSAVLDLGCGLGGDLIALARAGLSVTGVERDPLTAELARANLEALGLADPDDPNHPDDLDDPGSAHPGEGALPDPAPPAPGRARVLLADATEVDRSRFAAVVADPARRDSRGRVFDPDAYSPPWWFVQRLLADRTAVSCVKTAPIIEHDRIEPGVVAEWVSLDGEVKEAALWSGPDTGQGGHRRMATVLRTGRPPATLTDADDPGEAEILELTPDRPAGQVEAGERSVRYLYEPDGAVIRAGLVTAVAPLVSGGLLHPRIAYLVSDTLASTPFARAYRIQQVLPYGGNQQKRLRRRLAELGVGRLTVKKRGLEVDPDQVRRKLIGKGPNAATLILTRTAAGAVALITQPVEDT